MILLDPEDLADLLHPAVPAVQLLQLHQWHLCHQADLADLEPHYDQDCHLCQESLCLLVDHFSQVFQAVQKVPLVLMHR